MNFQGENLYTYYFTHNTTDFQDHGAEQIQQLCKWCSREQEMIEHDMFMSTRSTGRSEWYQRQIRNGKEYLEGMEREMRHFRVYDC